MQELERIKYVREEIEAIFEDFDNCVNKLIVVRDFLKDVSSVANGAEPTIGLAYKDSFEDSKNNTNCK